LEPQLSAKWVNDIVYEDVQPSHLEHLEIPSRIDGNFDPIDTDVLSLRNPISTYNDYQLWMEWDRGDKPLKQAVVDAVSQLENLSTVEYHPGYWAARALPLDESVADLLKKGAKDFRNVHGKAMPVYYDLMWDYKMSAWDLISHGTL
jgi:hypothetical protein